MMTITLQDLQDAVHQQLSQYFQQTELIILSHTCSKLRKIYHPFVFRELTLWRAYSKRPLCDISENLRYVEEIRGNCAIYHYDILYLLEKRKDSLRSVEICLTSLLDTFEYLKDCHHLVDMVFNQMYVDDKVKLVDYSEQFKRFITNSKSILGPDPIWPNLRTLKIEVFRGFYLDLSAIEYLLENSPNLEIFHYPAENNEWKQITNVEKWPKTLKEIKLSFFYTNGIDAAKFQMLLNHLPHLKKVKCVEPSENEQMIIGTFPAMEELNRMIVNSRAFAWSNLSSWALVFPNLRVFDLYLKYGAINFSTPNPIGIWPFLTSIALHASSGPHIATLGSMFPYLQDIRLCYNAGTVPPLPAHFKKEKTFKYLKHLALWNALDKENTLLSWFLEVASCEWITGLKIYDESLDPGLLYKLFSKVNNSKFKSLDFTLPKGFNLLSLLDFKNWNSVRSMVVADKKLVEDEVKEIRVQGKGRLCLMNFERPL